MSDYEGSTASLERASDLGDSPQSVVKRWLLELKLADKREADYRKTGERIYKRYRQKQAKKHSFNVLWSNTETLRPAVYNSLPQPDVRRRYKDNDPLGKAVAEVLKRSLTYGLDTNDFDGTIKFAVLDMLLPGRGVARVRYVPSLAQVGVTEATHEESQEQHEPSGESLEGAASEEVQWEQAPIEHVQWDDFRMGPGKCWAEVPWIAFRHRMKRDVLVEKFGEDIGNAINLDASDDEDVQKERDEKVQDAFKTAEVWEVWDKEKREVLFIAQGYKQAPCDTVPDPLALKDFFPVPPPLYAIEDSGSTVPTALFLLYEEQADELDQINNRINRIVRGLKVRGIYDATISELSEIMRGEDNDLIPAKNVTALLERGGLDKAIWFLPIREIADVLKVLFEQRESAKQVIYEITGIADIIRGASVATETATAQQIKDKWGSMRLKKMQAEVARFIRDLIRMQAEIIGERFALETFQTMTGLKYPSMEEKQQALMRWQQQAAKAQQQGQQPPPQPQLPPSWEEIIQILRDDAQRTFKVDVETDSTVAASVESDMAGLRDILQGVTQLIQGLGPAVQMGALPVEALKEIIMVVARRSKMGNAVEDALDQIKQPPPPPKPEQQQDNSAQVAQIKAQADAQLKQADHQHEQQIKAAELQHAQQMEDKRLAHEGRRLDAETALKAAELQIKQVELEINKVDLALKEREIGTREQEVTQRGQMESARFEREGQQVEKQEAARADDGEVRRMVAEMHAKASEPKKPRLIRRDARGYATHVGDDPIIRNPKTGLIEAI